MLAPTHIAFSILTGLFFINRISPENTYLYWGLVVFGALFVDIDHEGALINKFFPITQNFSRIFPHRGVFHSVWAPVLFFFPFAYLLDNTYGMAFVLGYCSHLVADSLTIQGINFLNPFTQFKIAGPIHTGSWLETGFMVATLGLIAAVLF